MSDTSHIVEQAIVSRQSVRGFLPKPVPQALIRRILQAAARAPSGSNIQPWKVHVVTGATRDALSRALLQTHERGERERREYQYYPVNWRSPYLDRRRETGWGLYSLLGIQKGDREASARQHGRNYEFFGAPCVLLFTIDNDLDKGSWLDYGMFLQNIMIMARGCGLDTCPQAALANYPDIVKQHLRIPDNQIVACGIAIGYQDPDEPANQYRTTRVPVDEFAVFHGD
ncbi:nitroreductase [Bordetella genomosp. 7]|uniref:Nitroreductase n=1 Tax=Bordetella genomosp. 7 TaxID=1416805 RepID=A0A261QWX1_9BORD|nr:MULTISPECIES: nitroreductase family protein [Bordetella]OZI15832.1 nitroreductase [Bordetella genomosp. 7]OZI16583.1 nitroreductase [Bordetella genomosp. 7]